MKDITHAHFNVKINLYDDEPIIFHCFRCDIGGILTPSLLRTFKISDLQMNSGLISYNKETMGKVNKSLGIINNDFNFRVPMPSDSEKTYKKKVYIEKRMGRPFTIEELVGHKVVFNLGDFLRENGIDTLTVKKEQAKLLHEDYVGFLTAKNEFINFRDITGNNKRYYKYSIFKTLDNTRKQYVMPNQIDLLSNNEIVINIAEGVFDIFGIYYHLFDQEKKNMIYTAVCGSGYISVLKYFIQMGVIGNVIVNIFSDSDRTPKFYKDLELEDQIKDWVKTINLFYNEKGKDYGVTKDEIKLIKKKL